jgi:hypothetical protein
VTAVAFSTLIMLNNFAMRSVVDQVASACLRSPASMFWSLSMSIVIKSSAFVSVGEGEQGVVGATDFL